MFLLNIHLIFITFGILFQFFIEVKSQNAIFIPDLRHRHTATFINDKLYIIGGAIPPGTTKPPKETFLYLDFSIPFNTNELKWNDLSATINNIIPPHRSAASIKGGTDNNTLFLYGGRELSDNKRMFLVYTFDTQSNSWRIPGTTGAPLGRAGLTPVVDYNGLIYLFSGITTDYTIAMFILDSIDLIWKRASSINAPSPRIFYGAVFLPNKNIIYMGGENKNLVFSLNEVYLYDTTNNIWTIKETNGLIPSARYMFSSVLGLDGQRVIIYGGLGTKSVMIARTNSLYVLDLNNFSWYIPKVPGNLPPNRYSHRAEVIGKYMVITFGGGYTRGMASDVLLLDISNNDEYIWTTSFMPNTKTDNNTSQAQPKTSNLPQFNKNNTGVSVSTIVGSLIGGITLTIGSFFLYKQYKVRKEQSNAIPTPGESDRYPQEIIKIQTTYYNHGQEIIPIPENTVQQSIDQNTLQNSNVELQEVKENHLEVPTKNFNQGSE